ncbi:DnaB-like helicase C terminal domain-containing protein [Pedobacter sp. ok626]|uniref:DnaB-like helicase C-terminal domain-containing protein n=1 Tax=Pedobacter sp. ok626 TaxID=1761882 RepID=UPI000882E9C6|nr:DnaB-like helicase C-terminal domain-containing protein [Pedobacter sp. ok626]SDJ48699.1 DnaB-like helicase C terminal domain-containing protein [Pedobacter sp. ok626]
MDINEENRIKFFKNLPSGTFELGVAIAQLDLNSVIQKTKNSFNLFSLFPSLDDYIGDVSRGDLILIAAKKGVGKTSFATTVVHFAARSLSTSCFIGFFDTDFIDYSQRLLVTESRTNINELILERISPGESYRIIKAEHNLKDTPITLYSDPIASLEKLCLEVSSWSKTSKFNRRLIFIDTVQFIAQNDPSKPSFQLIAETLNDLAKSTNSTIMFTSNVFSDTPDAKTPLIEDLEGGAQLSDKADTVLSIKTYDLSSTITVLKCRGKTSLFELPLLFEERWQTWSQI